MKFNFKDAGYQHDSMLCEFAFKDILTNIHKHFSSRGTTKIWELLVQAQSQELHQ